MKYDVQFKFTTDNSVMWVSILKISNDEDLGTHRLTCDELAEWLLEHEGELEKKKIEIKIGIKQYGIEQKGDKQMPNGGPNADRVEVTKLGELRAEVTRLETKVIEIAIKYNRSMGDTVKLEAEVAKQQSELVTLQEQKEEFFKRNNEQAKALLELVRVFDHPNHDAPERRYLTEIETAIRLLRIQDSEESHGTAAQLSQFIQRAKAALIVPLLKEL